MQEISSRIHRARSLEALLESMLAAIEDLFGFTHSMVLLSGEQPGRLVTIASRGYPENGAGAEVGFGEGIVGMVAEARAPIRVAGLMRELLYAHAVAQRARAEGLCAADERRIPLPGLIMPESQLGLPLLVRDELLGVLCIESEIPYRFHEQDRAYFEVLASYLALAIQNMLLQEREDAPDEAGAGAPPAVEPPPRDATVPARHEVAFYRSDECILVDGEYLIRSLPARLLWKILTTHRAEGRTEFTNRELRLDKTLNLPEVKDNLESRLLLLRRRLEQKSPRIRLVPTGRGRFALDLDCEVALVERV
jgi:hypothetical protein